VRFNAPIMPVYVVHNEHFENEVIIFRHGMAWLYSISRKRMGVGMDDTIIFYRYPPCLLVLLS